MTGPVTYVELNTPDLPAASRFLAAVFGWDPPRRRAGRQGRPDGRPREGAGHLADPGDPGDEAHEPPRGPVVQVAGGLPRSRT